MVQKERLVLSDPQVSTLLKLISKQRARQGVGFDGNILWGMIHLEFNAIEKATVTKKKLRDKYYYLRKQYQKSKLAQKMQLDLNPRLVSPWKGIASIPHMQILDELMSNEIAKKQSESSGPSGHGDPPLAFDMTAFTQIAIAKSELAAIQHLKNWSVDQVLTLLKLILKSRQHSGAAAPNAKVDWKWIQQQFNTSKKIAISRDQLRKKYMYLQQGYHAVMEASRIFGEIHSCVVPTWNNILGQDKELHKYAETVIPYIRILDVLVGNKKSQNIAVSRNVKVSRDIRVALNVTAHKQSTQLDFLAIEKPQQRLDVPFIVLYEYRLYGNDWNLCAIV